MTEEINNAEEQNYLDLVEDKNKESDTNSLSINTPMEVLQEKLFSENDIKELENIFNLFNLNIKKKSLIRTEKLSELQDLLTSNMFNRVTKHSDEFSNKDLLEYFRAVQDTINRATDTKTSGISEIQINQNQVNISVKQETLDADSRKRVADVIETYLAKLNNQNNNNESEEEIIEGEVIDNDEQEEDNKEIEQ